MSLTVSSTTDTQADVERAAGLEPSEAPAAEATATPAEAPPAEDAKPAKIVEPEEPTFDPDKPEEGEEGDEEEGEKPEEEDKAKPRKPGRYERRIDRLEQQLAYERRIRELEAQVAGRTQPAQQQQQPRQPVVPKPVQQPDETWEDYNDRVMDWKVEERLARMNAEQQAAQAREQSQAQAAQWNERVNAYKAQKRDYDETLASADHIMVPPAMQQAIMTSDNGPALVYALAQDHKELERLVKLEPLAAVRELGRLEAKITATQANPSAQRAAVSQAPEPIRPVGQGAATSTKPLDEMDFQEYKRAREKAIAARRRAG